MRFYLQSDNSRGTRVTAGNPTYAHLSGWDAGVKVCRRVTPENQDAFDVYMTGGSNGRTATTFLGTVTENPGGPVFTPAGDGWPEGKTFGELTPEQRANAAQKAAGQLSRELQANAAGISKALEEASE